VSKEAVVLIHGLWLNGVDMSLLRHRLKKDFVTYQFSYNSVTGNPAENAEKLQHFLSTIEENTIHFVAHSLGGLVVRYLFHNYPQQKPGRIVTLGTPHNQSHSAHQLFGFLPTRWLLGKSIDNGLMGEMPVWQGQRDLGSVAGTFRFGMGVIIPDLPEPNDGTVAVEETQLENMKDHCTFHLSHFGLLLSTKVSNAIVKFLKEGEFQV
jgi:pimeloyl-ACP methyl ester carboxylesterase